MSPETNHLSVFKEIFYFSIYSKVIVREQNVRLIQKLEGLSYVILLLINKTSFVL